MWDKIRKKQPPQQPVRRRRKQEEGEEHDGVAFRRNRTLTGTRSGAIESVSPHHTALKSPRLHLHHLTHRRNHLSVVLAIVLLVAALLGTGLYMMTARVEVSARTGALEKTQRARYVQAIEGYFSAHPFERMRFALDVSALEQWLVTHDAQAIARIDEVTFAGFGASRFTVTERTPIASWRVDNQQRYVDAEGIVFRSTSHGSDVPAIVDESGLRVEGRPNVASRRVLSFVGQFLHLLERRAIVAEKTTIPPNTTRQLRVTVKGGAVLIVSIDRSPALQAEDAARALGYLEEQGIAAATVDVRVTQRAFYR